jgi:hypothetical protein
MPQRESAIVGRNNVRAQVTGQEELLVKVNSFDPTATLPVSATIVSPIGQNIMNESISVALASDQLGIARTPNFLRPSGTSGTIALGTFSMSFASVGTANATVGGITLKPGETLNFDAGAINNTLGAVAYSTTTVGAELIIITLT